MYDSEFEYLSFLCDIHHSQCDLSRYINECCLMCESKNNIKNINILEENFIDNIKNIINKIIGGILKIWNKFVEVTDRLIKNNKEYLEKYKDIITRKKPIDSTYTMYNYPKGIPLLLKTNAPELDIIKMKEFSEKDNFISEYFKNFVSDLNKPYDNFSDIVKSKFRGGGETKIDSSDLNMNDIFNYCYTYEKVKNYIKKDIDIIKNSGDKALNEIKKLENNNQINSNKENNTNESFLYNQSHLYYSNVYESYINEAERDLVSKENKSNKTDIQDKSNPSKIYRQIDKDKLKKNQDQINKDNLNKNNIDAKNAEKIIKTYLNVCGSYISAKQTCAENAYKTYMDIIKTHINDYIKEGDQNK